MFGRSRGGAEFVAGRFEDFAADVSEEIDEALGNTLSIISGSVASESNIGSEAGRRGFFCAGEARTGGEPGVLSGKESVDDVVDVDTVVGAARVGGEWSTWPRREIFVLRW